MTDVRFVVHKTNDVEGLEGTTNNTASEKAAKYGENVTTKEAQPLYDEEINLSEDSGDEVSKFHLYEEEFHTRPPMSSLFTKLANYTGGIEPTSAETKELKQKKSSNKLGTVLGVYFPCIQNIFGVLYFVRLVWIIGCSGVAQGFAIVLICCITTMLTILSMSAIATNGKVPAGGSYFMISRSLGPEFGGTVGILFYFGTTIASAMYIIGAIEVLLIYIAPQASIFGDIADNPTALFNNTRIYGVVLLCILMVCVFIGIKFVSKFATISLACVIISILCVYIGIFAAHPSRSPNVCMIGDMLLTSDSVNSKVGNTTVFECHKKKGGPIYELYCGNGTIADRAKKSCQFFQANNVTVEPAFPGFHKPLLVGDFFPSYYTTKGHVYGKPDKKVNKKLGLMANEADITLTFTILLAIFFPSVTGIMAGSNRSGDLANPGFSIPVGTLAACATTSFVYLSSVVLFGATIDHYVMRDKFGASVGGGLVIAKLAWPNHWVILIGSFLSTVGAGLQSLTGAPRLLQAIAQDNVIPILAPFKVTTNRGEPLRAQALTFTISFLSVLIASIDYIAPLITMFFLMCYGFVNLATALNSLLNEPHWRPRFRFYHWTTSVLGLILCIALMFVSSWYYALIAMALAGGIYKYIEYRGAAKEWGDATQGFRMSAAKKAILQLGHKSVHTKNWRPQILLLVHMSEDKTQINRPKLLDFCSQLKAGKGLTMVGSVIEGELVDKKNELSVAKETVNRGIREKKIQGLSEIVVAPNPIEGLKILCQTAGLGNLRHNCVLLNFPERWLQDGSHQRWKQFMATIRCCQASELAVLVTKGIDKFPSRKKTRKLIRNGSSSSQSNSSNKKKEGVAQSPTSTNNSSDDQPQQETPKHANVSAKGDGPEKTDDVQPDKTAEQVVMDLTNDMTGTIDMWCVVHDGGLLMLLAHLLIRAKAWSKCSLRIFVVALETDNTVTMKKEVVQFVYDLRINAEVEVVELEQADISAYVLQRTMDMNMRRELLTNMNMRSGDSKREFQCILDKHHLVGGNMDCPAHSEGHQQTPSPSTTEIAKFGDSQDYPDSPPPYINIVHDKPHPESGSPVIEVQPAPATHIAQEEKSKEETEPADKADKETSEEPATADSPASPQLAPTLNHPDKQSSMKVSTTAQTLLLNTPDATPLQNQRSVTFANPGGPSMANRTTAERINEFTFSPGQLHNIKREMNQPSPNPSRHSRNNSRLNKTTRRMHSAVRLNEMIRSRSQNASLVILNLPGPSKNESSDYNYMQYVETLTEQLERILLVRGTGKEVITAYSE